MPAEAALCDGTQFLVRFGGIEQLGGQDGLAENGDGAKRPGELLDNDGGFDTTGRKAAQIGRAQGWHAQLDNLSPVFVEYVTGGGNVAGVGCCEVIGQTRHRVMQHLLFVGKPDVHGWRYLPALAVPEVRAILGQSSTA